MCCTYLHLKANEEDPEMEIGVEQLLHEEFRRLIAERRRQLMKTISLISNSRNQSFCEIFHLCKIFYKLVMSASRNNLNWWYETETEIDLLGSC